MAAFSIADFEGKCDSLYRLVIAAARRAGQISRPETRPLVPTRSRKSTVIALEEIMQGKVEILPGPQDEDAFVE